MSATNHTTNLNLPLFAAQDVPTWQGDWNEAMTTIDGAIGNDQVTIVQETGTSTTSVMSQNAVTTSVNQISSNIANKQNLLVSGENIKTINAQPVLGSGDLSILPTVYTNESTQSIALDNNVTTVTPLNTLSLPEAGTYLIISHADCSTTNDTNRPFITYSNTASTSQNISGISNNTGASGADLSKILTITAPTTVTLYAGNRTPSTGITFTRSQIIAVKINLQS